MRPASNAKTMNAENPAMTYNKVDAVVTDAEILEALLQWLHTAGSAGSAQYFAQMRIPGLLQCGQVNKCQASDKQLSCMSIEFHGIKYNARTFALGENRRDVRSIKK